MSEFNRALILIHRAQRVASRSERHDLCLVAYQTLEVVPIKLTCFGIHLRDVQGYPALNHQRLPGRNVSVVLELGDHDFISRAKLTTQSSRQMIDHCRRVWTEHDSISRRIQKSRKRITGLFYERVGFVTASRLPVRIG